MLVSDRTRLELASSELVELLVKLVPLLREVLSYQREAAHDRVVAEEAAHSARYFAELCDARDARETASTIRRLLKAQRRR